ncbi:MAG: tripartite tricarboxylate transporter substrate binding protein [Rhodoferax sp.]|nr:tripartite tricarboxylate transporter substrate binding protein [Rhodoferax sp.]
MPQLDRRTFVTALAGSVPALAWPGRAGAQTWPARPIHVVVPFSAGGGTDIAARLIVERLASELGQSIVVDNKPGAATAIGVAAVTGAAPDGYTLLFSGSTSYTVNPAVRAKLAYDPFTQLSPLALVARAPLVVVCSADSPYQTLDALVAQAARKPGELNYASFGPGSGPHLLSEMLAYAKGIKLTAIPYKGSSESTIAIIRNDVAFGIDTLAAAAAQVKSGKMRALAVVSEKRSNFMPQVPAFGELGLSSALFDAWYAFAGPARLPAAVTQALGKALKATMADPALQQKLAQQFMEPVMLGPDRMRAIMDEEITRYRAIVARANIDIG